MEIQNSDKQANNLLNKRKSLLMFLHLKVKLDSEHIQSILINDSMYIFV